MFREIIKHCQGKQETAFSNLMGKENKIIWELNASYNLFCNCLLSFFHMIARKARNIFLRHSTFKKTRKLKNFILMKANL